MATSKLRDLIEAAITENWVIMVMRRHTDRMTAILEQIIAGGMASGEFPAGDTALAARLVNQLESIFAKTNTHCLSELVEQLLQVKDDPPDGGPPLAPLGAAAALPLPEQDRFLSLGQMSTTKIKREAVRASWPR